MFNDFHYYFQRFLKSLLFLSLLFFIVNCQHAIQTYVFDTYIYMIFTMSIIYKPLRSILKVEIIPTETFHIALSAYKIVLAVLKFVYTRTRRKH